MLIGKEFSIRVPFSKLVPIKTEVKMTMDRILGCDDVTHQVSLPAGGFLET